MQSLLGTVLYLTGNIFKLYVNINRVYTVDIPSSSQRQEDVRPPEDIEKTHTNGYVRNKFEES